MTGARRIVIVVAFVAIVVVALIVRDPATPSDEGAATGAPSTAPSATAPTPVTMDQFCSTFEAMAAAHSNHLANDTPASLAEVTAAGEALLELEPGTAMPPPAREGLRYFVDGVIGRESEPVTAEASDAFTSFIETGCKPGS